MKKRVFIASILAGSLIFSATLFAQDAEQGHGAPEPPRARVHLAKGQAGPFGGGAAKLLNWNGGPVMHGAQVVPIFWGHWSSPGDKITGLREFYQGVGGSTYAGTNTEYTDGSGHVSSLVSLDSSFPIMDSSSAPSSGNSTSAILAEVCKVTNGAPQPGAYYPVYVSTKRGSAGYCAWHSAGSCNAIPVQFGFFFNLDGDPGCDPGGSTGVSATVNGNQTHSQGLAALASVSGHELSEVQTDPKLTAWYDRQGNENADKCAWTFGSTLLTFPGGSTWKIQGNWSNNAYNGNQGYTSSGTF